MLTTLPGLLLTLALGWVAGGAANWAADVLPQRRIARADILRICPQREMCPFFLSLLHYFTLWWYTFHKGVCPHCGEHRPRRAPLLEAATIGVFGLAWWRFADEPWRLAVVCLYIAFMWAVLVIDIEQRRVLNVMLAPAAGAVLLINLLPGQPGPFWAAIGAALGFGIFLCLGLLGRGAIGAGDVKLAGVIGLMTGYPTVVAALVYGVVLGGLAAGLLLITRRVGRKSKMAYAPYMAVGTVIVLLMGG